MTKPTEVTTFDGHPKCPHGVPKTLVKKMYAQWWEARDCGSCMAEAMAEDEAAESEFEAMMDRMKARGVRE